MFNIIENFSDGTSEAIDVVDDHAEAEHYARILNAQVQGLDVRYTVEAA
jgi:hypothetical protein